MNQVGGGVKSTHSLVFAQLLKKSRLEPTIKHPPKVLFFAIFSREKVIFSEDCMNQVGGGGVDTCSTNFLLNDEASTEG